MSRFTLATAALAIFMSPSPFASAQATGTQSIEQARTDRGRSASGRIERTRLPAPIRIASPPGNRGDVSVASSAAAESRRRTSPTASRQPVRQAEHLESAADRPWIAKPASVAAVSMLSHGIAPLPVHQIIRAPGLIPGSHHRGGSIAQPHPVLDSDHAHVAPHVSPLASHHHAASHYPHPPHLAIKRRLQPPPATLPQAATQNVWKTPYSYGYFGASGKRHWSRHHGYRDRYIQWQLQ